MSKANMDMIEQIVTRISEKLVESMGKMMQEFAKCLNESVAARMTNLETKLSAIELKLASATTNPCAVNDQSAQGASTVAEVISKTMYAIESQREEAQVKALNVIVSGLPPQSGVTDSVMFEQFCENNLTVKPRIARTRRLGRSDDGSRPAKLCVTLDSAESVRSLLESAVILRRSLSHSHVFINKDLTKAQAEAAYKARCRKRSSHSGVSVPPVSNTPPFPRPS